MLLDSSPADPPLKSSLGNENGDGNPLVALRPLFRGAFPLTHKIALEVFSERMKEILSQYEMEPISLSPLAPDTGPDGVPLGGETRITQISASFPKLLNDRVKTYIDLFQNKADNFFTKSLARSQAYEGIIRPILREKNLPEELLYLALIESGYDPYAQSRAKATGIWQFMKGTAKRFGLRVDQWIDERRDPEKSTLAAADYLKSLYEMFNCWYLAAAGYNAGEAKILQAMKRAKSQDFWAISNHRYLRRETKEYVPRLLAAMIIAEDPGKYGFSNIDYHPPLVYEKVVVPSGVRLDRIARAAETTVEEVRFLNPALRRDKIPPHGPSFEIKLPPGKKAAFERNFSRVFKLDPRTARKHLVRQGETLGQIAKKYKVDLRELCEGNEINPKTLIKPGMTLLLPP
jgi:membrane-bound lytic murein transglycosylase D